MIIQRDKSQADRTTGTAILPNGSEHKTLELPWKNNSVGLSCIPAGFYRFARDTHGRFQWFRLLHVPNRTHIEMHLGTRPSHSQGCILMTKDCLLEMKNQFFDDVREQYVLEIRDYV